MGWVRVMTQGKTEGCVLPRHDFLKVGGCQVDRNIRVIQIG